MTQVPPFTFTLANTAVVAQEQVNDGPQGPEFGKAAPVGLLVIVGLLVVILLIGYFFNRRMKKMRKRHTYAELHGIDPFDIDTLDRRIAADEAAGISVTERPQDPEEQEKEQQDADPGATGGPGGETR